MVLIRSAGLCGVRPTDADMDRSCSDIDCDDNDNATYPGAVRSLEINEMKTAMARGMRRTVTFPDPMACGMPRIDFLFIIDNSGPWAMSRITSPKAFLASSMPLPPLRQHYIMVVDSDESGFTGSSMSNSCRTINEIPPVNVSPPQSAAKHTVALWSKCHMQWLLSL